MLDSLSNFQGNLCMQFEGACRNFRIGFCLFGALFLGVPGILAQQAAPPTGLQTEAPKTAPAVAPLPQVPAGTGVPVGSSASAPDKQDSDDSSATKLGPGDLVEVSVYGVPELTTKARVSNDGDLYLPLIDYVHVGELSLEEAQKVIEKRLDSGGFVRNPHVTIFVNEYSSQNVTLLGEVGKPGLYPLLGDRRLFDLFSAAGGLSERASRTVSITRRNKPDQPQLVHLARNLTDAPESNVEVHPGDTIEVQRAPIVYVVGDVGRPSGLLIDNGSLTVMQAVALAGGANRTAKLNGTRIVRRSNGPNGMTEMVVPLKKMLRAKAPDMPLQANDILFIPVSGAKVATARVADTAISLSTAVGVYAIRP
jgi:polysaccharide biosynthesis/export protein